LNKKNDFPPFTLETKLLSPIFRDNASQSRTFKPMWTDNHAGKSNLHLRSKITTTWAILTEYSVTYMGHYDHNIGG